MKHNPYSIDAGYTIINSEKGLAESIQHETMGRFYDAIHSAGGHEVGPVRPTSRTPQVDARCSTLQI